MKKRILLFASVGALSFLTSCIDNDYDLSNIDKTVQLGVNELTVPINIDNITLDQVVNLDSESQVRKVLDPSTGDSIYAVVEDGTFKSEEINIPSFNSGSINIDNIEAEISLKKYNTQLDQSVTDTLEYIAKMYGKSVTDQKIQALKPEIQKAIWNRTDDIDELAHYPINDVQQTTFDSPVIKVHKAVRTIDNVKVESQLNFDVLFQNLDFLDNVNLTDVKIQLPKGLNATASDGEFDNKTGILDLSNKGKGITLKQGKYSMSLTLNGFDLNVEDADAEFVAKDNTEGDFQFSSEIKILGGDLHVFKKNFINGKTFFDLPDEARFVCKSNMSPIEGKSFTGKVKYIVDGINVKSVSLTDIPDFISGDETSLFLKNPQVYLTVNDPLYEENLYAEANVALTPQKKGVVREEQTLDDGALRASKAENNFCLSPSKPAKYYGGYSNAEWKSFKGLSSVLSGKGLPDVITVKILDPGLPEQKVTDFKLGRSFDPVQGKYLLYAPLDLEAYSVIVYEDKETGWNDNGTFNKVSVTGLKLTANVTSTCPLGAKITLHALDKAGNTIPGVEFNVVEFNSNASNQAIEFKQTSGTITNLDGVTVRASVATDGSQPLKPVQSLKLSNVKVIVTGTYRDEL